MHVSLERPTYHFVAKPLNKRSVTYADSLALNFPILPQLRGRDRPALDIPLARSIFRRSQVLTLLRLGTRTTRAANRVVRG